MLDLVSGRADQFEIQIRQVDPRRAEAREKISEHQWIAHSAPVAMKAGQPTSSA
jgi:hypothetical protein